MRLLDKILDIFNRQSSLQIGAMNHPNDLMKYIQAIRAHAFQKITGKRLIFPDLTSNKPKNVSESLSPLRRFVRRGL
ncbi:MAG: hypothetical protein GF411_08995 [Candidatus Lokiarchaeota archaeon]|nr:hypothetical protein [Candidatus Lokiarchaeota archaeon]